MTLFRLFLSITAQYGSLLRVSSLGLGMSHSVVAIAHYVTCLHQKWFGYEKFWLFSFVGLKIRKRKLVLRVILDLGRNGQCLVEKSTNTFYGIFL